jgi:hypothetical protein
MRRRRSSSASAGSASRLVEIQRVGIGHRFDRRPDTTAREARVVRRIAASYSFRYCLKRK